MKKTVYMLLAAGLFTFASCESTESRTEEIGEGVEEAGEGIEEGTEEIGEGVEEGAEELEH